MREKGGRGRERNKKRGTKGEENPSKNSHLPLKLVHFSTQLLLPVRCKVWETGNKEGKKGLGLMLGSGRFFLGQSKNFNFVFKTPSL